MVGRRCRRSGWSFAGTLLAALDTLVWHAVEFAARNLDLVPPFLTGVRVHGRIVTAVTAGAEDCRATLVVDVGGRHGVPLEEVGGVMRNARKQRLGLLVHYSQDCRGSYGLKPVTPPPKEKAKR